jgi:MoxR-like ATPase
VGAGNTLPTDPALAAFADRFLARIFVQPVPDAGLEDLLEQGWQATVETGQPEKSMPLMGSVDRLAGVAASCDLGEVRPMLATALRRLREAGVPLSDRRAVRSQRLVAAAAALDGRTAATAADLWVLPLVAPTAEAQAIARETLSDLLKLSRNTTLGYAAEEMSRGLLARAERLAAAGRRLLADFADAEPSRDDKLRLEATLREIDSSFAEADLPDALRETRDSLVAAVRA